MMMMMMVMIMIMMIIMVIMLIFDNSAYTKCILPIIRYLEYTVKKNQGSRQLQEELLTMIGLRSCEIIHF